MGGEILENSILRKRVKNLLESKNLTQKDLADKCQTTEATISRNLNGIHAPRAEIIEKIASVLDVTTDYLLGITNNPNSVKINVADADGTTMQLEYELLNKISGLTVTDLQKISEYVDFIKMQKGIKKNEK